MSEIGKAYIQIIPSSEGLKGKLTDMMGGEATTAGEKAGSTFASSMAKGIGNGAKIAAAAVAVTAAAVAGVTKAFVDGAGQVAAYGDNIDKMSQKMGISAKGYQEWEAVMQHSGTSMETLKASMKTLANAVENGNGAFERLGITQEQIASMNNEELFNATITALQGVEDETERTYLAGQLLGRGATELGALLNTSAEDTQRMKDRVHELGGVMSDEAVKAAAQYQDSLQDMTTAFEGMKRGMLSEFLPSLTTVMDGLTEIFSGNSDKGLGMVNEGLSGFVDKMAEVIPKVLEVGTEIVVSLVSAIIDNLPQLIDAAVGAIETLAQGIIDNLPQLIETGLQIILQLATSLSEALPELIPTIVEVVLQIVQTLIDNVGLLIDAAIALITGLTEGIIASMPILIDAMPQLITSLVQALIQNAPQLLMVGPQLIFALVQGILTCIPELLASVPQVLGELVNTFKAEAPKLLESGNEFIRQLVQGITNSIATLLEAGVNLVSKLKDTITREAAKLIESGRQFVMKAKEGFMQRVHEAQAWGRDLLQNFIDGIMSKFDALRSTLESAADLVRSILGFSEPEIGPLSNFHTFAPDMMKLFAEGIRDNTKLVTDQLRSSFDFSDVIMEYAIPEGGFAVPEVAQSQPVAAPAADNSEPIILNAYFGQERIDTIIFEAIERGKYRMGGRV